MKPVNYEYIAKFLLDKSALSLGAGKDYLLDSRLLPLAKGMNLPGIDELVELLKSNPNGDLATSVVEAMTTNETLFFRDSTPFEEMIQTFIPEIVKTRQSTRTLRIWCAACSTGQEPYSIAMMLMENFPTLIANWQIEFLCTDIDNQVLKRAQDGIYSSFEVQRGLTPVLLRKYFEQLNSNQWKIREPLRQMMTFKQLNLLADYGPIGLFDIIMCRNVLIYFETDTKRKILERLSRHLASHGCLFLGAAETIIGITQKYQRATGTRSAVYQHAQPGAPVSPPPKPLTLGKNI